MIYRVCFHEINFNNLYPQAAQSVVTLQKRWDNLQDLAMEWFDMVKKFYQDITVSIRVGATKIISVLTAVHFGMFVPIGFKKIGIDPAVAAGPLVTSGCDMISVSLYLGVIVALNKFF